MPALLVAGFSVIALGYAVVVPVFAAPDEPFHFEYVRHLAQHGALPDQTSAAERISSEGFGPPLYYAVLAGMLRVLDDERGAGLVIHAHADVARFARAPDLGMPERLRPPLNPRYVKWRHGDEPNMFERLPEDRFPWPPGPVRAVHWLRVLSVLCGAGTVWLTWRMARHVWPERIALAALATALVAFDPQFTFLAGSINNDNGVVLLSTASLLMMTRLLVGDGDAARDELWLGVWIGAALLVKTNAAFLLPLAFGVVAVRARRSGGWHAAGFGWIRVGVPVLAIAGWFVVRGIRLYGMHDPLGFSLRAIQNPDLVLPADLRAGFFADVLGPRLFQSWWGLFDWVTLPMPEPVYLFYGALSGLGVAGAVVYQVTDANRRERSCLALYAGAFALTLAALVFLNLTFHSAQARLLFPSIAGVAIVLAVGLDTAFGAALRGRPRRVVDVALPVGLALLAVWVLVRVVAPAYDQEVRAPGPERDGRSPIMQDTHAHPVAFVTGASRGIGKAGALALAEAGYDVVLASRTRSAGEAYDYGSTVADAGRPRAMPGSLEETAEAVRARGREALPIRTDLMDRASLDAAVQETLATWGRIDVLYNNGIYQGPGVMDAFLDLPEDALAKVFEGNFFAQFHLTRVVLDHMLERGSGTVVNMTSQAAVTDPPAPTGQGGWGFAYGASKGALHRMAGMIHVELNHRGIRAYNIDPGHVPTEAIREILGEADPVFQMQLEVGTPVEVPAATLVFILTTEEGKARSGETFFAPDFCAERGLVAGWPREA